MSSRSKREYTEAINLRYKNASLREKTVILDEYCATLKCQRKQPVQFIRSRAYHKDDNAHVEQKNWTQVRQWIGYDRLDNPRVLCLSSITSMPKNGGSSTTSSAPR